MNASPTPGCLRQPDKLSSTVEVIDPKGRQRVARAVRAQRRGVLSGSARRGWDPADDGAERDRRSSSWVTTPAAAEIRSPNWAPAETLRRPPRPARAEGGNPLLNWAPAETLRGPPRPARAEGGNPLLNWAPAETAMSVHSLGPPSVSLRGSPCLPTVCAPGKPRQRRGRPGLGRGNPDSARENTDSAGKDPDCAGETPTAPGKAPIAPGSLGAIGAFGRDLPAQLADLQVATALALSGDPAAIR